MQMSRLYESTSKVARARSLRSSAIALGRAGFADFADANVEMAEWLDPTPRGFRRDGSGELERIPEASPIKPKRDRRRVNGVQQKDAPHAKPPAHTTTGGSQRRRAA